MPPLLLLPLLGVAVGATGMYFLDPDRGRRRRARLRDQSVHAAHRVHHTLDAGARDLRNRVAGTARRLPSLIDWRTPSDEVLAERVRARLGRCIEHPGAVDVVAAQGQVMLLGSVLKHEHERLRKAVRSVRGVKSVIEQLAVYRSARGVSELQGGRPRRGRRMEFFQDSWGPGAQVIGAAAGAGLLLGGLRGGAPGVTAAACGALLLLRSTSNRPLREFAGGRARRAIAVQKSITINAPVELVFEVLSNYENYPRLMRNVRAVARRDNGHTHWVVNGPAGVTVQWNAVNTQFIPNELIAWRTLPGSMVSHGGLMRFEPIGWGTRVHIRMSYHPPGGALGHAVARLFHADPKSELDADLARVKTAIEMGRVPKDAAGVVKSHAPAGVPLQ